MTNSHALTRALAMIHANDPASFLVAADWLEEMGHDRAAEALRKGALIPPTNPDDEEELDVEE